MGKETTPPSHEDNSRCPDLVSLAAFVEGRLPQEQQNRIMNHLRGCPDCYRLIAESVEIYRDLPPQVKEEEIAYLPSHSKTQNEEALPSTEKTRKSRWQKIALLSPVAALLLLTLLFNRGPEWNNDKLLIALKQDRELATISQSLTFEEELSPTLGFNRAFSEKQTAFKTGTLLSKLYIVHRAGHKEKVEIIQEQLEFLLEPIAQSMGLQGAAPQYSQEQINAISSYYLDSRMDYYFKLGMFVESGKAYSLLHKSGQIDKSYFDHLSSHPEFHSLPPGVIRRFEELEPFLGNNSVAENDQFIYNHLQEIQQILL